MEYSSIIVYATLLILVGCFTLFTFDTWQTALLMMLFVLGINYLIIMGTDRLTTLNLGQISEGFVTESSLSKYEWLSNDDLFDDFYASVFTKLTQNEALIQAETAICLEEFSRSTPKEQLTILDAGCGIGIATCSFAKQGVGHTVGIDKSQAMIRYAKGTTVPNTTLTATQKQDVEFRTADLMGAGAGGQAEFTNACLLYFTVYYIRDLDTLFRNLAFWVKPGGTLAIEVVNKYKFDPILDSCNPWVGTSPQRHAKERLKTSKVVFDTFDYEATFELEDVSDGVPLKQGTSSRAEFRETFRFKDGSTRRQKHTMYMPNMPDIIKKAQHNGWTYTKYVDLMPLSFAYGYILFFSRNAE